MPGSKTAKKKVVRRKKVVRPRKVATTRTGVVYNHSHDVHHRRISDYNKFIAKNTRGGKMTLTQAAAKWRSLKRK